MENSIATSIIDELIKIFTNNRQITAKYNNENREFIMHFLIEKTAVNADPDGIDDDWIFQFNLTGEDFFIVTRESGRASFNINQEKYMQELVLICIQFLKDMWIRAAAAYQSQKAQAEMVLELLENFENQYIESLV